MRREMRNQRGAPGFAARPVAQRVQVERHAFRYAQFAQQLVGQHQQFHVRARLARADDFGVELVELAETALLRALVAEERAVGRDLERRILLPAFGDVGAGNRSEEHTSELQSLMRISYAVFRLKKKTNRKLKPSVSYVERQKTN